jgi:hypothetical protein
MLSRTANPVAGPQFKMEKLIDFAARLTAVDIHISRASGAANLGSCLTDVTRGAAPGVSFVYSPLCWRPNVCDSNRRGTLTRWNHVTSVPDCKQILKLHRASVKADLSTTHQRSVSHRAAAT